MDHSYAESKLTSLVRDLNQYTADEFRRQMARIISGATGQDVPDDCHTLKAERDALAKEVDAANDRNAELVELRDALAAQVEVQNDVIKYAHNKLYILSHNRNDVSARCIGDADKAFKVVDDYLSAKKTPQQCLRDIQAEAGRVGYFEAAMNYDPDYDPWWSADQYAESLRQGGAA